MRSRKKRASGFTLIELLVVIAIALVVAGMAIPYFINVIRDYRLRVAAINAMGMIQEARMRAVRDARFYSVYYIGANPVQYYVDVYPQNANGTSGNGGAALACDNPPPAGTGLCDPVMGFPGEIVPRPVGTAPMTGQLRNLFLPGSAVNPYDGMNAQSPVSFSAEGVPCLPAGAAAGIVGGSICNSRSNWMNPGAPVAFWVFYQHNTKLTWQAVTVTPAGRIQRWVYSTGGWAMA
jgi:prepilin-type N-terminal cleavage/methylation domain-containing protein